MVIHRDLSAALVVDQIPPARLAGLAVGRIPLALLVALADGATASGCCASRHSERARCLTAQQSRRNKANRRNQMVKSEK